MRTALGPLATALLVLLVDPAAAAWLELTPAQIERALAHGRQTFERWPAEGRAIDDVDPEYRQSLGPDVGQAILFTPFETLARATRRWLAIGKQLAPRDIEEMLEPAHGRLLFSLVIVGPQRDFLRYHRVQLHQGSVTRDPATWDIFKAVSDAGAPERWTASGDYVFSAKDLDPNAPVALVLRDTSGHEIRFTFDLGRLR